MKPTTKKEGCLGMLDTLMFFYLVVPLVHLIHEAGHVSMAKL
jgi:hypothetical protein